MTQVQKLQFWLDNPAGTLTEYSADTNKAALSRAVEVLDNTPLNVNDRSVRRGTQSYKLPLNGFYNDTSVNSIADALHDLMTTSVDKTWTWQLKSGVHYYNGEAIGGDSEVPGDPGRGMVLWSLTLEGDDGYNKTSVALS